MIPSEENAVDPRVAERRHTLQAEYCTSAFPSLRKIERASVCSGLIACAGDKWWIFCEVIEFRVEFISLVHVDRIAVSLSLPIGRNGDAVPSGCFITGISEAGRNAVAVLGEMEIPCSVEVKEIWRILKSEIAYGIPVAIGYRHNEPVDGYLSFAEFILVLTGIGAPCRRACECGQG